MQDSLIRIRNGIVHCLIGGKGDVVVILPSLWITSRSYKRIGEELSRYYTVIIPDLYKNNSKFSKVARSVPDYTEALGNLLEKLDVKKCYLIGVSFSGFIAVNYVNNFPSKVKKLMLLSTSVTRVEARWKLFRLFVGYAKLFWGNLFSSLGRQTNLLWLSDGFGYFLCQPKQFAYEVIIALGNYEKQTTKMEVPTKLIFAKRDEFIPLVAIDVNSEIKNLEIEVVDKSHAWFFLKPEKIIPKIIAYFSH